jgi:hypothetical protein
MPFNNISDQEMIAKSATVLQTFTPEIYALLVSLVPTPESYAERHNRYEASYSAALKGAPEKVKECEEDRNALNQDMTILLGVAKVAAIKDPTVPEKLGVANIVEKTAAPTATLTAPNDFKVVYDPQGQILASVSKVAAAKGYQVWACDADPNVDENWRLVTSATNCRHIVIPGLNRTKNNWLKIRAMRGNIAGPWSNHVNLTPS